MAIMVPSKEPRDYDERSLEDKIYESLKTLPDEYYVIHSVNLFSTESGHVNENEADFVVLHKDLGILCIEAKAGKIRYEDGQWRYEKGKKMHGEGPYRQASNAMHNLIQQVGNKGLVQLRNKCKFLHAVWFPSAERSHVRGLDLPPDGDFDSTLCKEDLFKPEKRIREIFNQEVIINDHVVETDLTSAEAETLFRKVLCPEFSIIPATGSRYESANLLFLRLLDSQARILNFLKYQKSAVINGAAGTGKTLIAVEHAKRCATSGDRVLFLCYNALLRDDLENRFDNEFPSITVMTINGYACSLRKTSTADFEAMALSLLEYEENRDFPFKHVVIDEGQDFGLAEIERNDILQTLKALVIANEGTFYLFYDERQFIQGSKIPAFINDSDCKLTLYVNCRNTKNIAASSMHSINQSVEDEFDSEWRVPDGSPPKLFASTDTDVLVGFIDNQIAEYEKEGAQSIVVLSCKATGQSRFEMFLSNNEHTCWRNTKIPFITCRRFKGLEADAVVLVDVNEDVWRSPRYEFDPDPGLLFYVGASRAKHELSIIFDTGEAGARQILNTLGKPSTRKPFKMLAKKLSALNMTP